MVYWVFSQYIRPTRLKVAVIIWFGVEGGRHQDCTHNGENPVELSEQPPQR